MFINWGLGELNLKIVYYGPALSGKTSNLQYIYARTPPHLRGRLVSLKTQQERTLLFDFLQLEMGKINNLKPKFKLYTVPGQAYYAASRRLILQGADGVVFVADSQAGRSADNLESWYNMEQHLVELGYDISSFPIVVQFNKRDMQHIMPTNEMRRQLNIAAYRPCFEASAIRGVGVFDTLKAAMTAVVAQVRKSA
ncbi:MAG: GTPase domain-containing protein [Chloroflexaceae bacterium]|nr:GTPase domain-containing protein [Chloroflexaceae bacterium]NJO05601.1 GTPase domain-containing protein [Chloroflexaceae bacterium]